MGGSAPQQGGASAPGIDPMGAASTIGGVAGKAIGGKAGGALGGAASGAAAGSSILPGVGTAIGAVVGGLGSLLGGKPKEPAPVIAPSGFGMATPQEALRIAPSQGMNVQMPQAGGSSEYDKTLAQILAQFSGGR